MVIPARTARLIVRSVGTSLLVAVVAVLVVIYLRSEGNGKGALASVRQTSASSTAGAQPAAVNGGGSGGSGGSGPGSCRPPLVCASESSAGSASTSHGSSAPVTYTGSVAENPYGPVQVSVTEQGGRIIDVKALQMPTEHQLSEEISQHVAPMLRTEVLQAQNAEIGIISGATYTSESYASSLQAALRQGG